jgi:hypothetical protein
MILLVQNGTGLDVNIKVEEAFIVMVLLNKRMTQVCVNLLRLL